MITVFGAPPSRSLRVLWMLEEMRLPYELRRVDFAKRREDRDFMAVSPAGSMPGMADGDVRMMESVAILEYLGTKYGPTPLAPTPDDPSWPVYLTFLHFGEASLTAPLNVALGSRFFAPDEEKDNWGARFAVDILVRKSAALAERLKSHPYAAGDNFTAADISCTFPLGVASMLGAADRLDPVLLDYLARLRERPAYKAAAAHAAPPPAG
jgi:glutathione S-transferase